MVLRLVAGGAMVRAFDPTVAVPEGDRRSPSAGCRAVARARLTRTRRCGPTPTPTPPCQGAAAVVVLTEWDEFRWLDFAKVRDRAWPPRWWSTPATSSTRPSVRRARLRPYTGGSGRR